MVERLGFLGTHVEDVWLRRTWSQAQLGSCQLQVVSGLLWVTIKHHFQGLKLEQDPSFWGDHSCRLKMHLLASCVLFPFIVTPLGAELHPSARDLCPQAPLFSSVAIIAGGNGPA